MFKAQLMFGKAAPPKEGRSGGVFRDFSNGAENRLHGQLHSKCSRQI